MCGSWASQFLFWACLFLGTYFFLLTGSLALFPGPSLAFSHIELRVAMQGMTGL
ncbi:hypothetical protein BDQ94DRAFT_146371 [Aspergillus welwitschiae]|uniref:Uncharacterized protein n=1 Tax=Aspergillus welwitschiae TaxID=1341132 RepID=A0A3F3PXF3_9EURO|nr:hypothetical protein BDQ94DRAFT_146371 [Aspergillus welwitschiae]RDH31654.1 hypothetical protein BDQ94DRAFT_146371 [Aspergillus welwitschiae]